MRRRPLGGGSRRNEHPAVASARPPLRPDADHARRADRCRHNYRGFCDVKEPEPMTCSRCKGPDQYYIIRDELWATAASAGEHLLCLACVEDSLARPLALDDYVFTEAEIQARFHAPP